MNVPADAPSRFNARALAGGWPSVCDPALEFRNSALRRLHEAWLAAGRDGIPRRDDLSLRTLAPHMRTLTILHREQQDGRVRYRFGFFGSGLAEFNGDNSGRYFDEVIPPDLLERWHAGHDAVLAHRAPLLFHTRYELEALNYVQGETYVAPLADAEGHCNMLLSGSVFGPR